MRGRIVKSPFVFISETRTLRVFMTFEVYDRLIISSSFVGAVPPSRGRIDWACVKFYGCIADAGIVSVIYVYV